MRTICSRLGLASIVIAANAACPRTPSPEIDTIDTKTQKWSVANTTDHFPLVMMLETDRLPELTHGCNDDYMAKIDWAKLSAEEVLSYYGRTDALLSQVQLPMEAIVCNSNCNDTNHCNVLCDMYNSIIRALRGASRPLLPHPRRSNNIKPGWNMYVAGHLDEAKAAHRAWAMAGRPRHGSVQEHKRATNARYKQAVRFIGKHEQAMRADSMAGKLLCNNATGFWKEVKNVNRSKTVMPCNVEGVSGAENITELWRQHYAALFNSVPSEHFCVSELEEEGVQNQLTKSHPPLHTSTSRLHGKAKNRQSAGCVS